MKTYSYKKAGGLLKAGLLLIILGLFSSPSYAVFCSARYDSIAEALWYENTRCAKRLIEDNADSSIKYEGRSALRLAYRLSKEFALEERVQYLKISLYAAEINGREQEEIDRRQERLNDSLALLAEEEADGLDFDDPVAEDVYNRLLFDYEL